MLLITVEIAPYGDLNNRRILGSMIIANNTTGDMNTGDYDVEMASMDTAASESFQIRGHERAAGFWKLIELAIRKWNKKRAE